MGRIQNGRRSLIFDSTLIDHKERYVNYGFFSLIGYSERGIEDNREVNNIGIYVIQLLIQCYR